MKNLFQGLNIESGLAAAQEESSGTQTQQGDRAGLRHGQRVEADVVEVTTTGSVDMGQQNAEGASGNRVTRGVGGPLVSKGALRQGGRIKGLSGQGGRGRPVPELERENRLVSRRGEASVPVADRHRQGVLGVRGQAGGQVLPDRSAALNALMVHAVGDEARDVFGEAAAAIRSGLLPAGGSVVAPAAGGQLFGFKAVVTHGDGVSRHNDRAQHCCQSQTKDRVVFHWLLFLYFVAHIVYPRTPTHSAWVTVTFWLSSYLMKKPGQKQANRGEKRQKSSSSRAP